MRDFYEIYETLCELDGETVARLFLDYHGTQLIDDEFEGFLVEEGYLPEMEEELYR